MNFSFTVKVETVNSLLKFQSIYERFSVLHFYPFLRRRLLKIIQNEISKASVSIDTSLTDDWSADTSIRKIQKELDPKTLEDFINYKNALVEVDKLSVQYDFSEQLLIELHKKLMGTAIESKYRKDKRVMKKYIIDRSIERMVSEPILIPKPHTPISEQVQELVGFYVEEKNIIHPFILSGLIHLHIVQIHPFEEGNGRLARIVEKAVLHLHEKKFDLLMTEDYYLRYRDRYYEVITDSIQNKEATKWLEFYAQGLLYGITESSKIIYDISGGAIDILNDKYIRISEREEEVINYLYTSRFSSASEIARYLNVTRQTAHTFLLNLIDKKIVEKIGTGTNVRFSLKTRK